MQRQGARAVAARRRGEAYQGGHGVGRFGDENILLMAMTAGGARRREGLKGGKTER